MRGGGPRFLSHRSPWTLDLSALASILAPQKAVRGRSGAGGGPKVVSWDLFGPSAASCGVLDVLTTVFRG